jgi:hypothetical protein
MEAIRVRLPRAYSARARRAELIVQWLAQGRARPRGLQPALVPTDRLLERWGISMTGYSGGPHLARDPLSEIASRPQPARMPPLPDDLAAHVEHIVLTGERTAQRFVRRWYLRRWESVSSLARDLGVHREVIYGHWNATLWYMRNRFLTAELDV